MQYIPVTIGISLITLTTYYVGTFTLTPNLISQLFFIFLFGLFLYVYYSESTKKVSISLQIVALLLTGAITSLVGSTGWFESPFSFTLYFLIIILTIFFPPYTSFVYVTSLLGIATLINTDGDRSITYLTIFSLLACIPISLYLRGIYLKYKESEKTILILKRSHKHYRNHVEEILDNSVDRFANEMRGELGIIKQLVFQLENEPEEKKIRETKEHLHISVSRALRALTYFEEKATGNKLVHTTIPAEDDIEN